MSIVWHKFPEEKPPKAAGRRKQAVNKKSVYMRGIHAFVLCMITPT